MCIYICFVFCFFFQFEIVILPITRPLGLPPITTRGTLHHSTSRFPWTSSPTILCFGPITSTGASHYLDYNRSIFSTFLTKFYFAPYILLRVRSLLPTWTVISSRIVCCPPSRLFFFLPWILDLFSVSCLLRPLCMDFVRLPSLRCARLLSEPCLLTSSCPLIKLTPSYRYLRPTIE